MGLDLTPNNPGQPIRGTWAKGQEPRGKASRRAQVLAWSRQPEGGQTFGKGVSEEEWMEVEGSCKERAGF